MAWDFDKFPKLATPKVHLPGSVKTQAELIVA